MSITIGKAIYAILSGSTAVRNYVSTKIFPLVIPEKSDGTYDLPAIVYERNSDVEYTVQGAGISDSQIIVTVLSEKYSECMDICLEVYKALNNFQGTVAGHQIIDIRYSGVQETYQENAYIQMLTFTCKSI
jgi:hypothetical protein